jgi:antitoxin MazE
MIAKIQKWGNSLGVRIPKSVAQDARIGEGSSVELSVEEGRVILAPLKSRKYTLKELVDKITPQNMHGESDWGPPVGKEAW